MSTALTWIVITRDVSHTIRVDGEPHLVAAMVLDQATGLVHGASIGPTRGDALGTTLQMALTQPPAPVSPQRPARVLCSPGQADEVSAELARLLAGPPPDVRETEPVPAAEDIFDSFIGHMSGRRQPADPPEPEDWRRLVAATHDYYQAAPWLRYSDADHHDLVVRVGGEAGRYVAIVLGQEGVQRGLVLYPGAVVPAAVAGWQPGQAVPVPAGTLMCYLDPPGEVPEELVARAIRHGWPVDTDLVPLWLAGGPDGGGDVGRRQAHHLTLATVAVATLLSQPDRSRATGRLVLPDGGHGEFTIG